MRRLLSYTCLGLILPFLLSSCEQEEVLPSTYIASQEASLLSSSTCTNYSYINKEQQLVEFGNALGDIIFVSFAPWVSPQDQERLLSSYPEFVAINGNQTTTTRTIAEVQLAAATTCLRAEQIMASLAARKEVAFTLPVFDRGTDDNNGRNFSGLTDEIILLLDAPESAKQLEIFAAKQKIRIVSREDIFFVVSVDKYSRADVLQTTTLLNQQSYVLGAEPSLTAQPVQSVL